MPTCSRVRLRPEYAQIFTWSSLIHGQRTILFIGVFSSSPWEYASQTSLLQSNRLIRNDASLVTGIWRLVSLASNESSGHCGRSMEWSTSDACSGLVGAHCGRHQRSTGSIVRIDRWIRNIDVTTVRLVNSRPADSGAGTQSNPRKDGSPEFR